MDRVRFVANVRRWLPRSGSLQAYLFAAVLVALGVLLRFPLDELAGGEPLPPYITLYPVIVISAFAGGIRVGFFAILASAAIAWLLWLGPPTAGSVSLVRLVTGLIFLIVGSITVLASGLARLLLDEVAADEEERTRATRESVHRIKNLIAVIQSISRKVSASATDVNVYRERLDARLNALAIAQDILLKRDWSDVRLTELIRSTLAPFLPNPRLELKLEADTIVPKGAVTGLSMALYELATNSMKYGALASPSGLVRLDTRMHEGRLSLEWREIGMAQVTMAGSAGLGTSLIRSALASIEDSAVHYDIGPQSVSCLFEWPIAADTS
ncbi:MAG: sensor histidine kinase [Caulobacteraceae bacterium]